MHRSTSHQTDILERRCLKHTTIRNMYRLIRLPLRTYRTLKQRLAHTRYLKNPFVGWWRFTIKNRLVWTYLVKLGESNYWGFRRRLKIDLWFCTIIISVLVATYPCSAHIWTHKYENRLNSEGEIYSDVLYLVRGRDSFRSDNIYVLRHDEIQVTLATYAKYQTRS